MNLIWNGCATYTCKWFLLLGLDSSTPIRITSPVLRTNPGSFNTVSSNPNFQSHKLCSFQQPAWMSRWKCWQKVRFSGLLWSFCKNNIQYIKRIKRYNTPSWNALFWGVGDSLTYLTYKLLHTAFHWYIVGWLLLPPIFYLFPLAGSPPLSR